MEEIEKTNMMTCLKEFVEEKVETPRCREILESLKKYLEALMTNPS